VFGQSELYCFDNQLNCCAVRNVDDDYDIIIIITIIIIIIIIE